MRSVLITGTSSGIGQATAVVLACRGWHVFSTMRNLQKRSRLEQALPAAGAPSRGDIEELDVTSAASIETATASSLSRTGNTLYTVVHNAGVAAAGALEDVPESELRRVMDTNFHGVLALTRALLPTLRTQRKGRIVITTVRPFCFVRNFVIGRAPTMVDWTAWRETSHRGNVSSCCRGRSICSFCERS